MSPGADAPRSRDDRRRNRARHVSPMLDGMEALLACTDGLPTWRGWQCYRAHDLAFEHSVDHGVNEHMFSTQPPEDSALRITLAPPTRSSSPPWRRCRKPVVWPRPCRNSARARRSEGAAAPWGTIRSSGRGPAAALHEPAVGDEQLRLGVQAGRLAESPSVEPRLRSGSPLLERGSCASGCNPVVWPRLRRGSA